MPQLKHIIGETFEPKSGDERRFFNKHIAVLFKNIYSTEEFDALFKASNIGVVNRKEQRHGYKAGDDEKVYECVDENGDLMEYYGGDIGSSPDGGYDSMASLLHGAHTWTKNAKSNAKEPHDYTIGHVARAVCMTATKLNLTPGQVGDHVGASQHSSRWPHEPANPEYQNRITGGTSKIAGKTHKEATKHVRATFHSNLRKCKKDGSPLSFSDHKSLHESLLCINPSFDDDLEFLCEKFFGNLAHSHKALQRTADSCHLPLSCCAGMIAAAHHDDYNTPPMSSDGGVGPAGAPGNSLGDFLRSKFQAHYHDAKQEHGDAEMARYMKESDETDEKSILIHMDAKKKKALEAAIADLADHVSESELTEITLTPAYGRNPKTKKAAEADWHGVDGKPGKDWIIADIMHPYSGKPANKQDLKGEKVKLRYDSNRKFHFPKNEAYEEDEKKKSDLDETSNGTVKRVSKIPINKWGDVRRKMEAIEGKGKEHHYHRERDKDYMKSAHKGK